jgi:hypothetical protein
MSLIGKVFVVTRLVCRCAAVGKLSSRPLCFVFFGRISLLPDGVLPFSGGVVEFVASGIDNRYV